MARFIDDVRLRGAGLSKQLIESLRKAKVSGSTSEINQMELTFTDPGWTLLRSGIFSLNASVDAEGFQMEIASLDLGDEEGVELVNLKCRPRIVRKLKERRGARVMKNASPSEFVISECRAVGAKYHVQSSGKRKQVARDVPKKGTQEVDNPPSSWTTFKRLANELGYIMFESNGVIHFGRPSWLISSGAINPTFIPFRYKSGNDDNYRIVSVPSATRSLDSPGETVSFTARISALSDVGTGKRFSLSNVPTFSTNYLMTRFSVDMTDPSQYAEIQGGVAMNPEPQEDVGWQPRRGTRLSADFVYWVQKQIGNRYVAGTQVNLGSFDPGTFDGAELVQWGAAQVGVYLPEGANAIIEYCEANGSIVSLDRAERFRGAIFWRNNYMGISLGNGQVIEQVSGRVGIRKGNPSSRYERAAFIPGVKYL
jgi:cell wall-associated NlpC family hydrolase